MPEVLTEAAAAIPPMRDYVTVETTVIVRCLECGQTDCATATAAADRIGKEIAERTRLEREVIEAAKEDLQSEVRREGDHGIDRMIAARRAYRAAVLALIDFESSQQQLKK